MDLANSPFFRPIPPSYIHIVCSPARALSIISQINEIATKGVEPDKFGKGWDPRLVWEPMPVSCKICSADRRPISCPLVRMHSQRTSERHRCCFISTSKGRQVFNLSSGILWRPSFNEISPNCLELVTLVGMTPSSNSRTLYQQACRASWDLAIKLSPDTAVVVRAGERPASICAKDEHGKMKVKFIPAYYGAERQEKVVDPTGELYITPKTLTGLTLVLRWW
jgi:hypothetical protein